MTLRRIRIRRESSSPPCWVDPLLGARLAPAYNNNRNQVLHLGSMLLVRLFQQLKSLLLLTRTLTLLGIFRIDSPEEPGLDVIGHFPAQRCTLERGVSPVQARPDSGIVYFGQHRVQVVICPFGLDQ